MSKAVAPGGSVTVLATEGGFDPDEFLLGVIRRVVVAREAGAILAPGGTLYIYPASGEYAADIAEEDLPGLCRRPAAEFKAKRFSEKECADAYATHARRNIDELLWHAALYASHGRLLRGCRRDDVVLLKHWPNFPRVRNTPNGIRLAALLTRYPTSVTLAHHLLKIPLSEVNEFYSAAHAAGWAVAVNRKAAPGGAPAEHRGPAAHPNRGLLAQILARVVGL